MSSRHALGITGAAFHHVITPKQERDHELTAQFAEDLELVQGFVLEFTLAILFIFSLFTVLYGQRNCCEHVHAASWKIGLIYTLCLMVDVSGISILYIILCPCHPHPHSHPHPHFH